MIVRLEREEREFWWGGRIADGARYPFGSQAYKLDLARVRGENQLQPLLLSSAGRWVWSEEPFALVYDGGVLTLEGGGEILTGRAGTTLREAALFCADRFYPPQGRIPGAALFRSPQYNSWIELMYNQNEEGILRYAASLKEAGYPPGVLMIDDTWQEDYGVWNFHPGRFKDPRGMIRRLHDMGFLVMLWVCPFVSPDSAEYRALAAEGHLILSEEADDALWSATPNLPVLVRWWNGAGGLLDLTHPGAEAWFRERLDRLCREYGVDGFKFDAGDTCFYRGGGRRTFQSATAEEQSARYSRIGLSYELNEYRATWKNGGQPLAQRLRDKRHSWDDLATLVPETLVQGLAGYPFSCPDMIGGGEFQSFLKGERIDQELVVRWAQCSALLPMMQFSAAPPRILDDAHQEICRRAAELHASYGETFLALARRAAQTGEPPVRSLAYAYPGGSYEELTSQFLLGEELLVAPVCEKGARTRRVLFPPGRWRSPEGLYWEGPCDALVPAPLESLPHFTKQS